MPEPEEVIIDAAHQATTAVARLWRRHRPDGEALAADQLEYHRERLRWLVAAAFGGEWRLRVAQPPAPPTLLRRLFDPRPQALRVQEALPATDGVSLFLPARLAADGDLDSGRWYRVLAVQQAARARGIGMSDLRARQFAAGDFDDFDLIVAMDADNLARIEAQRPAGNTTPVRLLTDFG
ncbi:MAG: hypothetical protein GVY22_10655, partial [Gammaproteobacteria bacterium]|nr:hypothetical protein [Gammaproteobacteria bacterium]